MPAGSNGSKRRLQDEVGLVGEPKGLNADTDPHQVSGGWLTTPSTYPAVGRREHGKNCGFILIALPLSGVRTRADISHSITFLVTFLQIYVKQGR